MRAVNLLPRETHGRHGGRRIDPLVAGGAALTVVVVAAVVGGFALTHSHASSEQQKLAAARSELARLRAEAKGSSTPSTPILPTPGVTRQQVPWQAALTTALSGRVAWDDVLSQLARVVPANVTVSTVTLGGATTSSGAHGSLQLGGTTFSEGGVAQLLSRLALVPDLGNIALTSSSADPKSGNVTFEISAQLTAPTTAAVAAPAAGATS